MNYALKILQSEVERLKALETAHVHFRCDSRTLPQALAEVEAAIELVQAQEEFK